MAASRGHADTATGAPAAVVEPVARKADDEGRNPGCALRLDWVADVRVNRAAAERRAATVITRRSVKNEAQAAWLVKAVTCTDLTTLNSDDTPGRVRRLCGKARQPLDPDLQAALGLDDRVIRTGAVCVYHGMVATAVAALDGSGIPVAAVAAGFPHGLSPMRARVAEVEDSAAAGASEIDIVISRQHVLRRDWRGLYDEVAAFRAACGAAHLKVILGTGDLKTLRDVARASLVAMMAGADFVKTSTGKEGVNATLPVALVMARTVRAYAEATGYRVGFKPAGGISAAKDALAYQTLMREELGRDWLEPELFRIGASGLVSDIERQLTHFATGAYAAGHRHAMP
ncbi:deoxyribose-phosphate aldolase [Rhodovibrio sodomensis]|uniref:Deoxyribose-phosphate aldolase n=1 Tax=Rhodovibrio sodomensis TaxID=1088 RepID=A0ABS1DIU8_9PROT|nr:deoxyribose-phosphate aldolase [Rhodovibrio sodomensis]MBK1669921.1 deoxyribose-phosphate aldolase [Rhodovibrio sodomensis]